MSDSEATPTGGRPLANPEAVATGPVLKRSWFYVLRKTIQEFMEDRCLDLAAGLTYYAVLSLFPAALALLSLLSLFGKRGQAVNAVIDVLRPLMTQETVSRIQPILQNIASASGGGIALAVGLGIAVWSASAWVNAFSRAMNRIFEVEEGRPLWKLRPAMLLITVASILLSVVALLILVVSGPIADSLGAKLGIGNTLLTAWRFGKWPVLAVAVVVVVALLYWGTPNVRHARFRIISVGALTAILVWAAGSVGFWFYVANFSNYNATYGSLGGVIVALLWLWLTNNALLLGGQLDAELERARQLAAGLPAEENLQLPVRDDHRIRKLKERRRRDAEAGRRVRESFGHANPADRPFGRR